MHFLVIIYYFYCSVCVLNSLFSSFCMIGCHSNSPVFHATYCTRYCLKWPLEHLTITFSFPTGLYFFQLWFFFLSCLSQVAGGKGHTASRLIGQESDLLYVLLVFRPTNASFLLPPCPKPALLHSLEPAGYWAPQDLYPLKYWETKVLAQFFTKLVPEPEENR